MMMMKKKKKKKKKRKKKAVNINSSSVFAPAAMNARARVCTMVDTNTCRS